MKTKLLVPLCKCLTGKPTMIFLVCSLLILPLAVGSGSRRVRPVSSIKSNNRPVPPPVPNRSAASPRSRTRLDERFIGRAIQGPAGLELLSKPGPSRRKPGQRPLNRSRSTGTGSKRSGRGRNNVDGQTSAADATLNNSSVPLSQERILFSSLNITSHGFKRIGPLYGYGLSAGGCATLTTGEVQQRGSIFTGQTSTLFRKDFGATTASPADMTTLLPYSVLFNLIPRVGGLASQLNVTSPATPSPAMVPLQKSIDPCVIARWNREMDFVELPNVLFEFLANEMSGNSIYRKAAFVTTLLSKSVEAFRNHNSSADDFELPSTFDINNCELQVPEDLLSSPATDNEEPVVKSLRKMLSVYSEESENLDHLKDVVDAAEACLYRRPDAGLLPCLDYRLRPHQIAKMEQPRSIFGSLDVCREVLSADLKSCVVATPGSSCTLKHLKKLRGLVKDFYTCTDIGGKEEAEDDSANMISPFQSLNSIIGKPKGIWSKLFGSF